MLLLLPSLKSPLSVARGRGRTPHATSALRLVRSRPAPSDEQILPPRNKTRKGEGGGSIFYLLLSRGTTPPPPPSTSLGFLPAPRPSAGRGADGGDGERACRELPPGAEHRAVQPSGAKDLAGWRRHKQPPRARPSLRSTSLSSRRGEHGHRAQVHLLVSRHAVVSTSTELMSTSLSSRRGEHRAQVHILVVTQW